MVLSPIEPVAPSTVTERTADATALLLRNGTALMTSPNHKTAADAIHATPQKAENRRQNDRGDVSVETIEQPAMPGNDVAGVLDTETPLYRGLKEIAKLRNDRKNSAQQQSRAGIAETERHKRFCDEKARRKPADGACPCLLGTDPRPELRSADAAAREITADIGHPHHQKDQHQRDKSPGLIEAHQHGPNLGRGGIEKSRRNPAPPLRREQRNGNQAERRCTQRSIDPSQRETQSGDRKRDNARSNRAPLAPRPHDHQPFNIEADRRQRHQGGPHPSTGIGDRDS